MTLEPRCHERQRRARQADQRVRRDVQREREALARGVDEGAVEVLAPGEGKGVHEDVELAVALAPPRA